MFFLLEVNFAVMILELTGSHPISARWASGASMRPTPSVWGAPSIVWPEYNSCSPVASLICPDCSHIVLLMPSTLILYLFFSIATCLVLPASYIVLTFHVAILVGFLGVRRGVGPAASWWLSLHDVICLLDGDPSSPRRVFWFSIVDAFVTIKFL